MLHPNYTLETDQNNTINFLDLIVIKEDKRNKLKIYRKPTTTAITINNTYYHPQTCCGL